MASAVEEAEAEADAVKDADTEEDAVGDGANRQQKVSSVSRRRPRTQPKPDPAKLQSPAPLTISYPGNITSQIGPAWA